MDTGAAPPPLHGITTRRCSPPGQHIDEDIWRQKPSPVGFTGSTSGIAARTLRQKSTHSVCVPKSDATSERSTTLASPHTGTSTRGCPFISSRSSQSTCTTLPTGMNSCQLNPDCCNPSRVPNATSRSACCTEYSPTSAPKYSAVRSSRGDRC